MSLTIHSVRNSQHVKAGAIVHLEYYQDNSSVMSLNVSGHDLLLNLLRGVQFYVPIGTCSVDYLFGFHGENSYYEDRILSHPVYSYPYEQSGSYDDEHYGNFYHNLSSFGNILFGQQAFTPDYSKEHFCRHTTYSGTLIDRVDDYGSHMIDYSPYLGYSYRCKVLDNPLPYKVRVVSLHPTFVESYGDANNIYNINLLDVLNGFRRSGDVISTGIFGPYVGIRTLSNVEYNLDISKLVIKWHSSLDARSATYHYTYHWSCSAEFPFDFLQNDIVPSIGGIYENFSHSPTFRYFAGYTDDPNDSGKTSDSYNVVGFRPQPLMLARSLFIPTDGNSAFGILSVNDRDRSLFSFKKSVDLSFPDITPSSLFSAVDAFMESEGSLNINILQNLQKLPGIADSLPKIREAISVASRLLKRDLSLSTMKEILDLSSSTYLQGMFEWRPYYVVLTTYLPQMLQTYKHLGLNNPIAIGRGSFDFQFPVGTFGREKVVLHTRSKIVLATSGSTLLAASLGLDALGLLPKPSALWDLVPFSFLLNWFTGIGASVKRAEYSAYISTLPAYFVHTYTLSSPLSQSELDAWSTSTTDENPASLKLYYRDVSLNSPVPRDSRFGFGIPSRLPPIGTLGCLLYQLIFS